MGDLHDGIKSELLKTLESKIGIGYFSPEWKIGTKQVDIAHVGLQILIEVEPTEDKENDGIAQVLEYAELALNLSSLNSTYVFVVYSIEANSYIDFLTKKKLGFWGAKVIKTDDEKIQIDPITINSIDELINFSKEIIEKKHELNEILFSFLFDNILRNKYEERLTSIFENETHRRFIGAIFEAYKKELIDKIYPTATYEKVREFYIKHTLLNAIAVAIISGLTNNGSKYTTIDRFRKISGFSLPYLNWWIILYKLGRLNSKEKEIIDQMCMDIIKIIDSFNWTHKKTKDIFRILYEKYISEEDRRKLGEYYTPFELVTLAVQNLEDINNEIIVDPCCGTGSFLDKIFNLKIQNGIDPDTAIKQIIGFDINPLAVILARAELIISYCIAKINQSNNEKNKQEKVSSKQNLFQEQNQYSSYIHTYDNKIPYNDLIIPFIYYADSSFMNVNPRTYKEIQEFVSINIFNADNTDQIWNNLPKIEIELEILFDKLESLLSEIKNPKIKEQKGVKFLKSHLKNICGLDLSNIINTKILAHEISKFGNGIWATLTVSHIASHLAFKEKNYIVATNPPWIPLSEIKGELGKFIRNSLKRIDYFESASFLSVKSKSKKVSNIISGGDTSIYWLIKWGMNAKKGVFVMPQSQVYSKGSYGLSSLLVLNFLKNRKHKVFLIEEDVFGHGIPSALVFVGIGDGEIRKISTKPQTSLISNDLGNYVDSFELKKEVIESSLEIEQVAKKVYINGVYIRGLKTGERKKDAIKMAGLILDDVRYLNKQTKIKFSNTNSYFNFDREDRIKKIFYSDIIFPFYHLEPYNVIVSDEGTEGIKKILENILETNTYKSKYDVIRKEFPSETDLGLLKNLIREVKQEKPEYLKKDKYYLIFRTTRIFSSVIFKCDIDSTYIVENHLGYIEFENEEAAYYYCALLNYLIFQVKRDFVRNQLRRPLVALNYFPKFNDYKWQLKIASISKKLHKDLKDKVNPNNKYKNKFFIDYLSKNKDFLSLISILNSKIDSNSLNKAKKIVSE
ncbi:MAG: N-6 DNA methylase [Nitrososphaeria archaeon]